LVKQFFDLFIALAAITADTKTFKQLAARTHAIINRAGNLPVSHRFTNTNVHGFTSDLKSFANDNNSY
jgi:hypothetical protein